MFYNRKVVISMETSEVLERERVAYDGPWELAKESQAEKQQRLAGNLAQTQAYQDYTQQLKQQYASQAESQRQQTEQFNQMRDLMTSELARQHALQDPVTAAMTPYLSGKIGFDPATLKMMQDKSMSDVASGYNTASGDVRSALLARGSGGGDLPVGGDFTRGIAELGAGKADAIAGGRRDINLASAQQALANKFNASSALMGGASMAGANVGLGAGARPMQAYSLSTPGGAPAALPKPPSFWGQLGGTLLKTGIGAVGGMIPQPGGSSGLSSMFSNWFNRQPSYNSSVNPYPAAFQQDIFGGAAYT